jgi:enoyl-CoA hydratase/carnithine racemase
MPMGDWRNITLEKQDGIAIITINRPKVLNALSWETVGEIRKAAETALAERKVVGLILTANGGAIAGADITELATVQTMQQGVDMCKRGHAALAMLEQTERPTVAALNGPVLGGGCEIAMACRARVIGPKLMLGQPEVNLGVIPGYGGTQRLPRLIGVEKAADLLRTGRTISAAEACEWGWAYGEPVEDVIETAKDLIHQHVKGKIELNAIRSEPLAFHVLPKVDIGYHSTAIDSILCHVMEDGWKAPLDAGLNIEAKGFGRCIETEDYKIGMKNFTENGPRAKAEFVHR